ncbi:MAG: DUF167 domain-containing protein [Thermodesulfobacteriota bacterium]
MQRTTNSGSYKSRYPFLIEKNGIVFLRLLIQPRASKDEVMGPCGDTLKLRLTSPPVEDKANRRCIEFLANLLGIRKSQIELIHGKKSRKKEVKIIGLSLKEIGSMLYKVIYTQCHK